MDAQTPLENASPEPESPQPRDVSYWARRVTKLKVAGVPTGAVNLNVDGRTVVGPLQGFGQLWRKTYRIRLKGAMLTPVEIIKVWKENFPSFWMPGNKFHAPLAGIAPGEVALINLTGPGGAQFSTGVMVLYADEESFTLMTPQGHMFSGWITFSAFEGDGCTVAQVQVLMRSNDPLYEIGMRLGGHRKEDESWQYLLRSLARHLGAEGQVETQIECVDPRRQWSQIRNIWYNAWLRSMLYTMAFHMHRGRNRGQS